MKTNNRTLILCDLPIHLMDMLSNEKVKVKSHFNSKFSIRILRRICRIIGVKLSNPIWYSISKQELQEYDKFIIFETQGASEYIIEYLLKHKRENQKIIYWYWNPVIGIDPPPVHLVEKGLEIYSFDRNDCSKYNLKFNTTFYYYKHQNAENNIINDIYFVGLDKGRKETISKFIKASNNKNHKIIIVDPNDKSSYVTFDENIKNIKESKAILDIVQNGQEGLTLRVMEALFFEKKLITTQTKIKNESFYNKNNIFILGEDKNEDLNHFLDLDYIKIDSKIINSYHFYNWIERF